MWFKVLDLLLTRRRMTVKLGCQPGRELLRNQYSDFWVCLGVSGDRTLGSITGPRAFALTLAAVKWSALSCHCLQLGLLWSPYPGASETVAQINLSSLK